MRTTFKVFPFVLKLVYLCVILIFTSSCKKAEINTNLPEILTPPVISVGDHIQGGIVAYIFKVGDSGYNEDETHGLIVAETDQSLEEGIPWYNGTYIVTGAIGTAFGTGSTNTDAIILAQGAIETNYAAGLAKAYRGGDFNDWFLPSKDELNAIYVNRELIEGNFGDTMYWTSNEVDNNNSWVYDFNFGSEDYGSKSNKAAVRAVRVF